MSTYVVGVSGGIGSGKTTVTNLFAELGIDIIDADVIAREVVAPQTPGLNAIVAKLGQDILDNHGHLNRALLRQLVFTQPDLKEWLNQLLHPLIREQMQQQTQGASSPYCILSVPLLVENQGYKTVDRVLIVDVSEATQLQRTVLRDNSNVEQISAIMRAQASREQRLAVADDVIENEGSEQELIEKVAQLHQLYLSLAESA
ncbi:MAG: dephospho-CoA kinase [Paraglaciecola sp.]|uniref:dephospho-CoA kinase n=1 Tax=Paraglaciecola sp. TaxID=1920173 RepID=UPI00273E8601|nr:dephospho-CoA kinase [Paraglaciecola sp.]MDP5029294.1 dephospho-CoA kinase [Paraglaciecola sp.]MDP5131070.1 dephospho-CoA kinase [Paraglaciecola sp.]